MYMYCKNCKQSVEVNNVKVVKIKDSIIRLYKGICSICSETTYKKKRG